MKDSFSVLKGGALRRQSQVTESTIHPAQLREQPLTTELIEIWEAETEKYAEETGIGLEDVRERVMPFWKWMLEQGYSAHEETIAQLLTDRKTDVDDQVTGMIVLARHGLDRASAAWDTYLGLKKPGAYADVLSAQVNQFEKDVKDTAGTLQSILSRLLLY